MKLTLRTEWTDARLVEECLAGNQRAWCALIERYKNLIYSIPVRYGAPPQDAADIFQSVCLELFGELGRLRDAGALSGWLIRVALRKSWHWRRQQAVQMSAWDENHSETLAEDEPLTSDVLLRLEREQMLREAIAGLPERCGEMIELLFFRQPPLPYEEVGKRLGLARGSIGFIRGRCLKRLKSELEKRGFN